MADNPYVTAAGYFANGADSAAAAGVHFAAALRAAAAQQQQQQQTQNQQALKDQFETELKLRKDGYTPYYRPATTESSGLKRRGVNPDAEADPSRVIQDHFGRRWVAPGAKPDATPQQTYSDTMTALRDGGKPVQDGYMFAPGGQQQEQDAQASLMSAHTPVPDSTRVVTPPGGKQGFYVPTRDEKAAETLEEQLRAEAAKGGNQHIDTENFSAPVIIDPKSGKATAITLPAGVTHTGKPEKTSRYQFSYHTSDDGTVHVLRGDPDSGEVTEVKAIKGAGGRRRDPSTIGSDGREMTPGQSAVQGRFDQREMDGAQKQLQAIDDLETRAHGARHAYGTLSASKDGDTVIDPETKREMKMSPAYRQRIQLKYDEATQEVEKLRTRKMGILQRYGGAPQAGAPATAPSGGGRGAPQSAARPRARNPQTGAEVEWDGKAWVPISR